jgi:hypothetical protein
MAFDLTTWNPCIGTTDDDKYDLPGSTRISGSKDTGAPTPIDVGDPSHYSSIPTDEEIAAGSGINQVIALVNRRTLRQNQVIGSSYPALPYLSAGAKITPATINAIMGGIITARAIEGMGPAYDQWPGNIATGQPILGAHVAHMRKALAVSGTLDLTNRYVSSSWGVYERVDAPYGTPVSEAVVNVYHDSASYWGKQGIINSELHRRRSSRSYPIPYWLTAGMVQSAVFSTYVYRRFNSESTALQLWSSNTSDRFVILTPAYDGTFYHTDNLEGTFATWATSGGISVSVNATHTVSVSAARLAARAGNVFSTLIGTQSEVAESGQGVGYSNAIYYGGHSPSNWFVVTLN